MHDILPEDPSFTVTPALLRARELVAPYGLIVSGCIDGVYVRDPRTDAAVTPFYRDGFDGLVNRIEFGELSAKLGQAGANLMAESLGLCVGRDSDGFFAYDPYDDDPTDKFWGHVATFEELILGVRAAVKRGSLVPRFNETHHYWSDL